jgi:hypothetical protein
VMVLGSLPAFRLALPVLCLQIRENARNLMSQK